VIFASPGAIATGGNQDNGPLRLRNSERGPH
jgi:hypothetical protein